MSNFKVGDWVVVVYCDVFSKEDQAQDDFSTYGGLPCVVTGIQNSGRVSLYSPMKVCLGRPPLDSAPPKQLLKISAKDGDALCLDILGKGVQYDDFIKMCPELKNNQFGDKPTETE